MIEPFVLTTQEPALSPFFIWLLMKFYLVLYGNTKPNIFALVVGDFSDDGNLISVREGNFPTETETFMRVTYY